VFVQSAIDREAPSLFAAMSRTGEGVDLSLKLAGVFAGDVDFNSDLQPGDRFELVVDKLYREDGDFGGYGDIRAAELDNAGRRLTAIRFAPEGEPPGYFDEQGRSLRRFFLRSPLRFEPVVTSRFSLRRLHPVLHEYRPHLGVDYRAPEGAPVVAVADGVVRSAGWNGSAGRMVHLRHANGFETQYLHLSSVAVRAGTRVRQGDLIGRVGSTGLATGPHLDYRVRKNGAFIDPVAAHRAMPPGDTIPADQMAAFQATRDRLLAQLAGRTGNGEPTSTPLTP
jgi:murein DD-endopeptidase MepM/ murein hydrolase activator NlpD